MVQPLKLKKRDLLCETSHPPATEMVLVNGKSVEASMILDYSFILTSQKIWYSQVSCPMRQMLCSVGHVGESLALRNTHQEYTVQCEE